MNFRDRPRSVWAFPLIALALALGVLGSDWAGMATTLRGTLFDTYQRVHPRSYEDTRLAAGFSVRVLDIDEAAAKRLGPWPWPHATLARVMGELRAEGAEMIVLTAALDRADAASPRNLIAEIPPGPTFDSTRQALERMPSPDQSLAQIFARVATVTGFTLGGTGNGFVPKERLSYAGAKYPFSRAQDFPAASGPVEALGKWNAGSGALNLASDRDGIVRRMPLVFQLKGRPVASLDAEVLRVAENRKTLTFRAGDGGDLFGGTTGVGSVTALNRDLPTAADGSLWIAYSKEDDARNVSATALGAHRLAPGRLKNAIVYIGSPANTVVTPFGPRSEADVHAEAMENMLTGAALRRPASANKAELACLLLIGLAAIFLFVRLGVWWAGAFVAIAVTGAGAISWHLFTANKVLFDALGPGTGLALVFVAGALARILEVANARARLHEAFADSLAAASIERIARRPALLKLEGEMRNVTYLVCGVRGFTSLAVTFRDDPVAFTRLLARVFTPLMDEALAHRGTIERISSESFSCFWNAPLDDAEHAIHACEAASGMMEVIARINDIITHERRIDGTALAPVEIGIGISTGPAIAGGFKSHGRTTYSAVGECAVMAAHIQGLSSTYGPAVIVSEDTRKAAERGFAFLEVDFVETGMGTAPVKLYAMLGNPVMRASPKFRALSTFHDHIFLSLRTQQWDKAKDLIDQCRKLSGASQKLYDLQLARIAWYESHSPGPDWDGAFRPILK